MPRLRELEDGTELTPTELRTVKLAGMGASHKEIAQVFGVCSASIDMRFYRIARQLGTRTTAHTVVECLRRRWIRLDELAPEVPV